MVLREGKRGGGREQNTMPSSELARANSILQPFPFLPLQTKTNASIPFWALGQSIHSLWGMRKHHPSLTPHPHPGLQAPTLARLAWPLAEN